MGNRDVILDTQDLIQIDYIGTLAVRRIRYGIEHAANNESEPKHSTKNTDIFRNRS